MLMWYKIKMLGVAVAALVLVGGAASNYMGVARAAGTTAPTVDPGPFLISGKITAVAADSITVQQRATTMTITIDGNTVIKLDNAVTTVDKLKVDLAVGVFGINGKPATEIRAFTPRPTATAPAPKPGQPPLPPGPFQISGQISAVAADSISVTQRNHTTVIPINANTVYRVDLKLATLADLQEGMGVGVWATAGKPAVEIRAYTPKAK